MHDAAKLTAAPEFEHATAAIPDVFPHDDSLDDLASFLDGGFPKAFQDLMSLEVRRNFD